MATAVCRKRLQRELVALKKNPVEHMVAAPHEKNILEWHYVIEGPKDSVYEGGIYHGVLRFPREYPYKPPSILMYTRNGRFKTGTRLCLSMSDFHPETWNPMWSVSSILSGLLSFMLDTSPTLGSIDMTEAQRRMLAAKSLDENVRNKDFCALFPSYVEAHKKRKAAKKPAAAAAPAPASAAAAAAAPKTPTAAAPAPAPAPTAAATPAPAHPKTKAPIFSWGAMSLAVLVLAVATSVFWFSATPS